jgi:hypothetical protein
MDLHFSLNRCNLLGAVLAVTIPLLTAMIFVARLAGRSQIEHGVGLLLVLLILPLIYLFISGFYLSRPKIYFLWIGLMIVFLIVELLLDYVLKLPFRAVRWQAIAYVMLFFGSTGGMLGVATLAGRGWTWAAVTSFLVMAALAFVQRHVTGI